MLHTQNQVWDCIYDFLPKYKLVRDNGVHLNLPTALRDAAVEIFIQSSECDCKFNYTQLCSADSIRIALTELRVEGQMTFLDNEE